MADGTIKGRSVNDLPRSSYAYCEPNGGPCHFPIKDANGKPDAAHVRNALARLSQSPFGPKARPAVEAAARKLGIGQPAEEKGETAPDNEKKESLHQVSEMLEFDTFEAMSPDAMGRPRARMTIIKAGRSLNRRNYRESALRAAVTAKKYDGVRMFVNHSDKPPLKRPVEEMVSAVESAEWDEPTKSVTGTVVFFDPAFAAKAQAAKGYMGTSVSNLVRGFRTQNPDGTVEEDVHSIERVHSVDWVVYPAAGGELQHFLESEGEDVAIDWTKVTADDIRKNAPGVLAELKEELEPTPPEPPEPKPDPEPQLTKEAISAMVSEAMEAYDAKKSQASAVRTAALSSASGLIAKSGLPQVVRQRLTRQFEGAATEAITDATVGAAIKEAEEEVKALGVSPKLTGHGPSNASMGGGSTTTAPMRGSAREGVESLFIGTTKKKTSTGDASEGAK